MGWLETSIRLVYLGAAACFVLGLHLMNSPATARNGNRLSAAGMAAAVLATVVALVHDGSISGTGWLVLVSGGAVGSGFGLYAARTVQMTAMPQLVSLFNAVGGGAAALLAVHDLLTATDRVIPRVSVAAALDITIGAITFTGSVVAAGKLQGLLPSRPVVLAGARVV